MNILNVESATNFSGGVNQLIINVKGLIKKGHKVTVACVEGSPVHRALNNSGADFFFIEEDNVYKSAVRLRKFLSWNNFDIVHTHHSKGHTIGLLALLFRKKEKLVVQRSVLFPTTNVFKYLNPRVDLFIANSYAVKNVMQRHFVSSRKIRVVYSAVDESELKDIDKETVRKEFGFDGNVFGVVGNYSSFKGHDIAVEAFKKLDLKNSLLVLVGKDTEKLQGLIKELDIADRVKILGFRENAYRIIAGFDALVIPSLRESLPNVAIEAFLLKVPVIGTNVGGIPELLSDGRGIIANPTVDDLAKAMMDMVVANRNEMKKKAFEFAKEHLTAEKKVERLVKVYEELLS